MQPEGAKADICVFIGRFRPFHNGHLSVVQEGLRRASRLLILVGSSGAPRSLRNPFTFDEVERMILGSVAPPDRRRVIVRPLEDSHSDELWIQQVQSIVSNEIRSADLHTDFPRIALIGLAKDHTSYYLKLFPQWASFGVPQHKTLAATTFRDAMFKPPTSIDVGDFLLSVEKDLPRGTMNVLDGFIGSPAWSALRDEADAVAAYRKPYEALPYPPVFVAVDAVVVKSGHVLLIRRGKNPGKGLWAVPGGYLNADEPISIGWLRELIEETTIAVPEVDLRAGLVATQVFDDPHRDARGRMITHAHLVHLPPGDLPFVAAADDAAEARWIQLAELDRRTMFADHYSIVRAMLAKSLHF